MGKQLRLITLMICILSPPLSAETISVGISDYCPLTCINEGSPPTGIIIDVLKHAFSLPDYDLSFHNLPYMRAFSQAQLGELTAIGAETIGSNEAFIYPRKFMVPSRACTYTLPSSSWTYNSRDLDSLEGVKIGMIQHYSSSAIDKKLKTLGNMVIYETPGVKSVEERLLKMILSGRIDTSFLPSVPASYIIRKNQWQDRLRLSGCGHTIYRESIAFSVKNPEAQVYADKIDTTYGRLKASGKYAKLLKTYGIQ